MLVSSQLDWVTITRPLLNTSLWTLTGEQFFTQALWLVEDELELAPGTRWAASKGQRHYALSFFDAVSGVQVDIPSPAEKEQGLRLTAPGKAVVLRSVRSLRAVLSKGWRPTRVDLAWNIQEVQVSVNQCYAYWKAKSPKRDTMTAKAVGSSKTGETMYVGSRSSDFYMRLYDKAKEQGMEGRLFFRLEVELKGDLVRAVFEREFDHVDALATWVADKAGLGSWFGEPYRALMSAGEDVVQTGEIVLGRKETNRERWFSEQVIPAFKKMVAEDREGAERVLGAMMIALNKK